MAVTAAGANGAQPRIVGTLSGKPFRVADMLVTVAGVVPGDFVTQAANVAAVWADTGLLCGIFLGSDQGGLVGGIIGTPGIDLAPAASGDPVGGVFNGDGPMAPLAANTNQWGRVAIISPDCLVEVDINANLTMTTVVPGAIIGGIGGGKWAHSATSGWVFDLDANSVIDDLCEIYEILVAPTSALRGRAIVRFHDPAKLSPGG